MEEVNEFVDNLETLWNQGQLTEVAHRIANIYSSMDYRLISGAMVEFKRRINK